VVPALPSFSVRFRLSTAIAVLFGLILLVSIIGMRVLDRTETWMNVLHQETLTEVSEALDLSRHAADLATSAPFLYALFPPFQLEREAEKVRDSLARIETHASDDPTLALPMARLRLAIDDLTAALVPQAARKAALTATDRDMQRLNARARKYAADTRLALREREIWASLQQLTASAIAAGRAAELIELGEFTRHFNKIEKSIEPRLLSSHLATYQEIQAAVSRDSGLFVLKHRALAAQLDAENALFRIRQEVGRITTYAEEKVALAESRLSRARAETSHNLGIAKKSFLTFTLMSLLVAVTSALYVSRYVTRNLKRVATAMRALAQGDHRSELPRAGVGTDEIGQLFAAFQVFRDNARKLDRRTAQVLRQNALFSRVFRNIKDGVAITSVDGQIDAENQNLRALLRLPSDDAKPKTDMETLIARSAFVRQASADERGGFEEYVDPSGHVLELRHSPLPDGGAVWLLSETTERKRIDERLEEIRRVETLGKVTGEVAHDFGNILSSISGNLHLLENADDQSSQHFRARIRSAVDLGVSLTERLLAFARKQHLEPQVTDIGLLIEGMADLLEMALPAGVSLEFQCDDPPVLARVDPGQLESAIFNLCVNAGQAIKDTGTIRISVGHGESGGARLSIQDSGCGMTPDVLRRATEPFFTHRNDGNGTGLGLSMVDGFVHQSGGRLTIQSRTAPPQTGTTVTMEFPPLAQAPDAARKPRNQGTILVVDDDLTNLTATSTALEHLGYVVLAASSFGEGRNLIKHQHRLDMVISDLNLDDGASGWELLQLACDLHPTSDLVLMSTRQTVRPPDVLNGLPQLKILTKPLTETVIAELIGARRPLSTST